MSFSKEARIGLLAIISLVVFFIGFYFLKGSDLFANEKEYFSYYSNVDGLVNSAGVEIRGLNVGRISSIRLAGNKGIKVGILVEKNIDIPEGTVATIAPNDLLGNKIIRLDLGHGSALLKEGTTLPSSEEVGIVDNVSNQISPLINSLRKTVSALDTVIAGVSLLVSRNNTETINKAIQSINVTSDNLAHISTILGKEGDEMAGIVHNTNSFTANLAKNNDTIQHIISSLNSVTSQLAKAPIQKTFSELQSTTTQLKGILDKINNNEGSLGLVVNNKDLYNNLNSSLLSLQKLMEDMRTHPSRYINVTIFGKKKK